MDNLLPDLQPFSQSRVVKKGANILFQGEIPRKAMIVRDGVVRAYTITSAGEERIVALYGKGDIFPLSWVLGETSNTLFYYDALTDARLMTTSRDEFNEVIDKDPERMRKMMQFMAKEYTSLLLRITGLEQSRAIEKVGFTLYYLLFRYGTQIKPEVFTIDVKISQVMIASLVGITRESTTRCLTTLKEKGIIDYQNSTYTIHKSKLEGFLGEDAFRDLSL